MTTRAELERRLITAAKKHRFKPDSKRFNEYVYGTLDSIFPRAKKAAVRRKRTVSAKPKRRKNPVVARTTPREMKLIKAVQLFQKFRLQDPKLIQEVSIKFHKEMAVIGLCDGILYTTVRQGKKERYRHLFTGDSKPTLCASWDGKQLYLIGGHYNFTERGIVDA